MTTAPTIHVPAHLRPADGRFGSGPSKIRPAAVSTLVDTGTTLLGTSHRQAPVRRVVARVRQGISDLFGLPDGYEVVLGNGGTTAFWDAAAFGLIRRRSRHASFGEFSSKFVTVAARAPWLDKPSVAEAPPGTALELSAEAGVDAYALTHNETSTGVIAPVNRPAGADEGALVLVDATSAAGGVTVDPDQFDVYYFAPQKCFASDGGLWLAAMSPAALGRVAEIGASGRYAPAFLDLGIAVENSRLEQTYNTPSIATLLLLDEQVDWITSNGGLAWSAARTASSAAHALRLGRRSRVHHPIRRRARRPLAGGRHDRLRRCRRCHGRHRAQVERDRGRRALSEAGPQPAPHRDVPGDRS